jgi:lipopolysaccharide export system permease protein
LLLEDVYKNFGYCLKAKASLIEITKYYAILAASFYTLITPIALFLATLFALGNLHKRNEITAMKCAGINMMEIAKPIIASGIILALANLVFEALLAPMAIDYVTSFRIQIDARAGYNMDKEEIGFLNHPGNRIWVFKKLNKLTGMGNGVMVICSDSNNREESRIFGTLANFSPAKKYWQFKNCTVTTLDPSTGMPVKNESFAEQDFPFLTENPETILASLKKTKNLSFRETMDLLKYSGEGPAGNGFRVKFHKTFANSVNCLTILFLAIFSAAVGTRESQFANTGKAMGCLLLFFITETIFAILGNHGILSPLFAAWGAGIFLLLPIGKLLPKAM